MLKRRNNRRLYDSIMSDVAKTIKRHLNENVNEYYIWYANQEDGKTHDMTYEEINSYRLGWQVAGPYDLNTAKREIINIAEKSLLNEFWIIENEVYDEYEETELTDKEKINYVKNSGNFYISRDGKYISFGELNDDSDYNTMEWMILTKEEIEEREEEFNNEEDDDEYDDEY